MDLTLVIAIVLMVLLSAFVGALARDICFSLGGKAWSKRAFGDAEADWDTSSWDAVPAHEPSGRSSGSHRKPRTPPAYLGWLAHTDAFIQSLETKETAGAVG